MSNVLDVNAIADQVEEAIVSAGLQNRITGSNVDTPGKRLIMLISGNLNEEEQTLIAMHAMQILGKTIAYGMFKGKRCIIVPVNIAKGAKVERLP